MTPQTPEATPTVEPSMADIAAWLAPEPAPQAAAPAPPAEEAKSETPEADAPVEAAPAEDQQAESGTAETKQEPTESVEEQEPEVELPPGVQKKIAAEARKQAAIQAEIAKAVSSRKAAEDELRKVTSGSGSDPAKETPKPQAPSKPVRPKLEDFSGDNSWNDYQAATGKYETDNEAWIIAETRRVASEEFAAKQREADGKREWETAVKADAELPAARDVVVANASEAFVTAVSQLDNWAKVTAHLGKNPDELKALDAQFKRNPYSAVAALGKLEDRLTTPAPKQPAVTPPVKARAKPLPEPPTVVGGSAAAAVAVDMEKASTAVFNREFAKMLAR